MTLQDLLQNQWARQTLTGQSGSVSPLLTSGLLGKNFGNVQQNQVQSNAGELANNFANKNQALTQQMQAQNQNGLQMLQNSNNSVQNTMAQQQQANTAAMQSAGSQPSSSAQKGNTFGKLLKIAMAIYGGGAGAGTISAGLPEAAKTVTLAGQTFGL